MPTEQLNLPFNDLKNSALLSSHWLENRLELEPEWTELFDEAKTIFFNIVELWKVQRNRVENYGAEPPLEEGFIQPVFEQLGWKINYQTYLQGRRPDYALFLNDELLDSALVAGRTSPEFWQYPTIVADAKAWHIPLDRPTKVNNKREYPPEQIEHYLKLSQLKFGILTNGKLWRLIPREIDLQQRRFQTYLELNLPQLLNRWLSVTANQTQGALFDFSDEQQQIIEEFFRFYLFFNPKAFYEIDGRQPLISRAIEGSSEYRLGVSEGLKERTFEALRLCVEGFLSNPENGLDPSADLEICREQSFVLMYRLLFIMYAEDRKLLPYKVNRTYTNNRSLGRKRDEISGKLDRAALGRDLEYPNVSTAIWSDLIDLFDLVDRGHGTYGVPAYNGGLFNSNDHNFLTENQISDKYMARIIDQLGRASDPNNRLAGLFRVDYHDLAIQHLGGIYEGLLELHPHYADERMIVLRKRGRGQTKEIIQPASQAIPQGFELTETAYEAGSVYLVTDAGERRATGSYYTPDHIVEYIVENTLNPLCRKISEQLDEEIKSLQERLETISDDERTEVENELEKLKNNFDNRVFDLSVLDPSMGSGHFLIRACQYLAEEIATHPYSGDPDLSNSADDESALSFWKRRVVERCIYGVDMNPMAVELAKLALWLETVASDQPLSFLDHHLRHGNSLFGARLGELGVLHGEISLLNNFSSQVEENLPILLAPLAEIRNAPSDTIEQVKQKEKLHKRFERIRKPFRLVGDLWCAEFSREGKQLINSESYLHAVSSMTNQNEFNQISEENWFQQAINIARQREMSFFHWELEFPEIFFGENGRLENQGFDAIIGNPPYDVLSEAETGQDLTTIKSFIAHEDIYAPSRRGKNNLYKLFICRSLELLNEGGYLGFITPMPILGDDQAADVRRRIVAVGSFKGIEAFPQKDNPNKRVFPEAKLSTAVFTFQKGIFDDTEFTSRVHPANSIELNSPSLTLTTSSIPLYDPSNFTIVSCSQADWTLATRIMETGNLGRLENFVEFYQGEINETNEKRKGTISSDENSGSLILRASAVCLYVLRDPSQNTTGDLYVNTQEFLSGKSETSKAYAFRHARVGIQGNAPQNNFRRLIAAYIPENTFCFYTINFCPAPQSNFPLSFLLALLNSKLCDWYFRLGSTNAHANQYQINNLPCPIFSDLPIENDERLKEECLLALENGNIEEVLNLLSPSLENPPFSLVIQSVIIEAVNRIIEIETRRGEISRSARSSLASEAQIYQDLIDKLFYKMAGLTDTEAEGLEERLSQML